MKWREYFARLALYTVAVYLALVAAGLTLLKVVRWELVAWLEGK